MKGLENSLAQLALKYQVLFSSILYLSIPFSSAEKPAVL